MRIGPFWLVLGEEMECSVEKLGIDGRLHSTDPICNSQSAFKLIRQSATTGVWVMSLVHVCQSRSQVILWSIDNRWTDRHEETRNIKMVEPCADRSIQRQLQATSHWLLTQSMTSGRAVQSKVFAPVQIRYRWGLVQVHPQYARGRRMKWTHFWLLIKCSSSIAQVLFRSLPGSPIRISLGWIREVPRKADEATTAQKRLAGASKSKSKASVCNSTLATYLGGKVRIPRQYYTGWTRPYGLVARILPRRLLILSLNILLT